MAWGQVNNLAKSLPGWTGGRSKLCMVPFHSYIYVTWKSKEVVRREEVLKPSFRRTGAGAGVKFLWDAVDHYRHHAYNLPIFG